jgi:hypothetical protein
MTDEPLALSELLEESQDMQTAMAGKLGTVPPVAVTVVQAVLSQHASHGPAWIYPGAQTTSGTPLAFNPTSMAV